MARRRATPAGEALASLIGSLESGTRIRESLAIAYWSEVVGAQAAAASQAESVRDGTLVVRTRSSAWSHELSLLHEPIVAALNQRIGRKVIHRLQYRAIGVKAVFAALPGPANPTPDELNGVQLPASTLARIRRSASDVAPARDPKLRGATEALLVREHKLRAWRLANGWKSCCECDAVHALDGPLCPVCRSEAR